jgi:hypothetical protein
MRANSLIECAVAMDKATSSSSFKTATDAKFAALRRNPARLFACLAAMANAPTTDQWTQDRALATGPWRADRASIPTVPLVLAVLARVALQTCSPAGVVQPPNQDRLSQECVEPVAEAELGIQVDRPVARIRNNACKTLNAGLMKSCA